jgi:rod shape-determining protein MreD
MSIPWSQLTRDEKQQRLLGSWRLALPTGITLLSLLIMLLPVWVPGPLMPQMGLLGVAYWVLSRRSLMPPLSMFIIGLAQDLWLGTPLGLNALLLLGFGLVLSGQVQVFASRPFSFGWLTMLPVAALYALLSWVLMQMFIGPVSFLPSLLQAVTTALCYPVALWAHARVQRRIIDPWLQPDV